MNRSLKKLSLLLTAAAGLAFTGWGLATHAAPATAHSGDSKPTKARGAAPSRDAVNKGAGKSHGKTKSRGAGDTFHVDNHTDYAIDVYVDGHYKATVSGMGDLYINDSTGGDYTVEGFAPGTSLHWGPRSFTTPYTWKLYD